MEETECDHSGAFTKRFSGAITCDRCGDVIGYWKQGQPKIYVNGSFLEEKG